MRKAKNTNKINTTKKTADEKTKNDNAVESINKNQNQNMNLNVNQATSPRESKKKFDWPLLLLIISFLIISSVFIFKPMSDDAFTTFNSAITLILPLIAVIAGLFLIRLLRIKSLQGKVILFLTIGFLCWGLADAYWNFAGQKLVSLADAFYFAGYLALLVGIFQGIRISDPGLLKNPKKFPLLLLSLIVIVGAYLYFYPLSWNYDIGFLENISTAGYVVADLLLIISVLFLIFSLLSGFISNGWIFFGLGMISTIIGDLWYASNYEAYAAGQLVDLLWFLGYFFFIYALVHFRRAHRKTQELVKQHFLANDLKSK